MQFYFFAMVDNDMVHNDVNIIQHFHEHLLSLHSDVPNEIGVTKHKLMP